MSELPLAGVRVLDLGDQRCAWGGRLLADLGAEVTLIEPLDGQGIRRQAPFVDGRPASEGSYRHLYLNANKRSRTLDWRTPSGFAELARLLADTDILIESLSPSEFPLADLRAANPHLIVVSATTYGLTGTKSGWRATDLTASAASGLLQVSGERVDPPVHGAAHPAYTMTGLTVASAAMTALHGRDRTPGQPGAHVEVGMQRATSFQLVQTSNPCVWRWRDEVPVRPALSQAFRCADDRWMGCNISPNKLSEFIVILDEAGIEHDLDPENWQVIHRGDRAAWQYLENPLQDLARELASTLPRAELLAKLWAAQIPAMPTLKFSEFMETEHYPDSGQFLDLETAGAGRSLSYSRSPLDGVQGSLAIRPAPTLGEHNDAARSSPREWTAEPIGSYPTNPLEGIRVLDLTWVAAGPLTTRLLANFGADVIKVESTGLRMDPVRVQQVGGEYQPDLPDLYNDANTGKRSITIDLASQGGKALLRRLAARVDVLVNNYSAGSLARMGFPYEELRAINPRLIVLHLPGVGGRSPWRPLRSLGNLLKAASGLNFLMGFPDRPPRGMGIAYPDFTTPHIGATAVLAALRARGASGEGREIELSQLGATVALLGAEWMQFARIGRDLERPGNTDPNMCPHGVFPSEGDDQWVAIALESDELWTSFAVAIGQAQWTDDPEMLDLSGRQARRAEIEAATAAWTSQLSKWDAAEQMQALGIAANAAEDLRDMMDVDEHFRDHYQRVEQPSAPGFGIWIDGAPWEFTHLPPRTLKRAPMLGEHNEDVLRELLGMTADEVADLTAAGVLA